MSQMVNTLILKGYLKSDLVIDAFSEIHRVEFVPEDFHSSSDADVPLPIGYGRLMPEPQVVASMLELLGIERGQRVLEIGSGSGWITSLLSYMVGSKGSVYGIDSIQDLVDLGRENCDKYQFVKRGIAHFVYKKDIEQGYSEEAPYDRIFVNVLQEGLPESLQEQVVIGGRIIAPVFNTLWCFDKVDKNTLKKESYAGFSFIPSDSKRM
jgi:protein-L-isoaspartate(D-aspartate) O-methyltransferase